MASIRRTLSPVPRPGTSMNGEACLVSSPLSKSSSSTQNYPPPMVSASFSSFDYALYRVQTVILGLFSRRTSRPLERPKTKGQVWRRSLLHFFICFVLGVFYGVSPSALMNLSVNLMPQNQAFSFDVVPQTLDKVELFDAVPRNVSPIVESSVANNTFESQKLTHELQNGTSNDTIVTRSVNEELDETHSKLLIIVTPTYARPFQAYYLNRLAFTLKLIPPPLLWIVVEMGSQSAETAVLLMRSGVMYRHLVCNKNLTDVKDKAVHQRNVALSHIETHRLNGIVYFANDDNIYSVDLFEHMRQIRRFGTWLVAKLMERNNRPILEGPICNETAVIGWHTNYMNSRIRRFHAEISGFAFNSTILWDPKRWHRPTVEPIRQFDRVSGRSKVSTFIEQVVEDESQMECILHNSSRIMVWHLHVESSFSYSSGWFMKHNNLNATVPLL